MSDHLSNAEYYRARAAESVALAEAAVSNEIRAHHYAIANRYLLLAEAEAAAGDRARTAGVPPAA
jgi:hypothetical protein